MKNLRRIIADWLSFIACKLRGDKWYEADAFHGVPGNRAAELRTQIWQSIYGNADEKTYDNLQELAQLAGENWGHIFWNKNHDKK